MAAATITNGLQRPTSGAQAVTSTLSISSLSVGYIIIPPAPLGNVLLSDGTTLLPGDPKLAREINGIVVWLPNAEQIAYGYVNTATVPRVGPSSTSAQAAPTPSSQSQAITGATQPPNTVASTGLQSESTSNGTVPTSSPTAKPAGKSGLSSGAAAGLAIGCLLAGAILAGAFLWFFCIKRRRSRPQYSETNTLPLVAQEKGFSNQTTAMHAKGPATAAVFNSLPQPLEDKAISGDISKISNAIKNHVQSFYHNSRVSLALIDHDDLQALGPNMPIEIGFLSTLLGNSATREITLRFCIAWAVISRMQESSAQSDGLLPAEIAGCHQQIRKTQSISKAQNAQTSQWRTMTANLMHSTYVRNPFSPSDSRNASIRGIIGALDNVLQPYADSRMGNEERKRNLEEIIKRSALFAFTLFSQPSQWEFDWKEEQGVKSGELCIFPALVQIVDDNGEAVRPPRPFSEAVVRKLEGVEPSRHQPSAGL